MYAFAVRIIHLKIQYFRVGNQRIPHAACVLCVPLSCKYFSARLLSLVLCVCVQTFKWILSAMCASVYGIQTVWYFDVKYFPFECSFKSNLMAHFNRPSAHQCQPQIEKSNRIVLLKWHVCDSVDWLKCVQNVAFCHRSAKAQTLDLRLLHWLRHLIPGIAKPNIIAFINLRWIPKWKMSQLQIEQHSAL